MSPIDCIICIHPRADAVVSTRDWRHDVLPMLLARKCRRVIDERTSVALSLDW